MQLENKVSKAIETSIKNIQSIIDTNTVIGKPIENNLGKTIIPITKTTIAVLTGGGEYGKTTIFKKSEDLPFSAGNGTVVSMKPCGFLVEDNNTFKFVNVGGTIEETLIQNILEIISKNKGNYK